MTEYEDGSSLRNKLEETQKRNRDLEQQLSKYKSHAVISENGYRFVKAEDLSGFEPGEIEERAQELEASRKVSQEQLVRDLLTSKGVSEDNMESAVQEFLNPESTNEVNNFGSVKAIGNLNGTSPSITSIDPSSSPLAKIRAGLEATAKRQAKRQM